METVKENKNKKRKSTQEMRNKIFNKINIRFAMQGPYFRGREEPVPKYFVWEDFNINCAPPKIKKRFHVFPHF